jgi:hypothetical protein
MKTRRAVSPAPCSRANCQGETCRFRQLALMRACCCCCCCCCCCWQTRTMQAVAATLANRSGTFFAVRSSGSRHGAQTSPIFGPSSSLMIHIHVDVTNGKKPHYPPAPPTPPAPPAPPAPPPAPPSPSPPRPPSGACVSALKAHCNRTVSALYPFWRREWLRPITQALVCRRLTGLVPGW